MTALVGYLFNTLFMAHSAQGGKGGSESEGCRVGHGLSGHASKLLAGSPQLRSTWARRATVKVIWKNHSSALYQAHARLMHGRNFLHFLTHIVR